MNDDDKKEVERMIKDRELKIQLWWLEKIPFVAIGFFWGVLIVMALTHCTPK